MSKDNWSDLASALSSKLKLQATPIAITFSNDFQGVPPFEGPTPRRCPMGGLARSLRAAFSDEGNGQYASPHRAEDHGNCSVGSLTHGLKTMDEVAGNSDVAALLDSDGSRWMSSRKSRWSRPSTATLPTDRSWRARIRTWSSFASTQHNLWSFMTQSPVFVSRENPSVTSSPIAKEQGEIAASVGCMLSRVRTGMSPSEMTCAIPASKLGDVIEALDSLAWRRQGGDVRCRRWKAIRLGP